MAYIGKEPAVGNFVKLDAITTSSTNTYNLTLDSVAFTPESANHMLVSLNGVIQAPQTSFSVSGSTITFLPSSGTLSSSDSIDFIMVYGNVLSIGTPSDSTVTNAKTNFVSTSSAAGLQIKGDGTTDGTLQLNCSQNSHGIKLKSPPHSASQSYTLTFPSTAPATDKILQTNSSGVLSFVDQSAGITEMDQWRLSSSFTSAGQSITSNLERNDTNYSYVGTGISESSGVFTFPSTGIYLILFQIVAYGNSIGDIRYAGGSITATTDNASYSNLSEAYNGCNNHGSDYYFSSFQQAVFDVTNVSTHKIKLQVAASNSNVIFKGSTSVNATCVTFIRIGDT